jgi:heme/copper-type cytochrome/quinol oxidase subunit 2
VALQQATVEHVKGSGAAALWYGILVPPLSFGADLLLSYALVAHACSTGHFYLLHLITIIAVLVTLSAGLLAWREYNRIPRDANDEGGSPIDRAHFMAIGAMIWSAAFVIVIIANAVPRWILSPCD